MVGNKLQTIKFIETEIYCIYRIVIKTLNILFESILLRIFVSFLYILMSLSDEWTNRWHNDVVWCLCLCLSVDQLEYPSDSKSTLNDFWLNPL